MVRGVTGIGLFVALQGCAKPPAAPIAPPPVKPVVLASTSEQTKPSEPRGFHLNGAWPEPYSFVPNHSKWKVIFPVIKEFTIDEGTLLHGENDKVGTPFFDGYQGLQVKLIRGLSASEVRESIDIDIAKEKIQGVTKSGARYGFTSRLPTKPERDAGWGEQMIGIAELDLVQKDISGSGYIYVWIQYQGNVDPKTLQTWLFNVVNGYSVELVK